MATLAEHGAASVAAWCAQAAEYRAQVWKAEAGLAPLLPHLDRRPPLAAKPTRNRGTSVPAGSGRGVASASSGALWLSEVTDFHRQLHGTRAEEARRLWLAVTGFKAQAASMHKRVRTALAARRKGDNNARPADMSAMESGLSTLADGLAAFKEQQRHAYTAMAREAHQLEAEVETARISIEMSAQEEEPERADEVDGGGSSLPPVAALRPGTTCAAAPPLPPSATPSMHDQQAPQTAAQWASTVADVDAQIRAAGGATGGWPADEHTLFASAFTAFMSSVRAASDPNPAPLTDAELRVFCDSLSVQLLLRTPTEVAQHVR
ncbi:MAG: hypothetical protein EOO41_04310, partial [Methanobacteriota archaeon]